MMIWNDNMAWNLGEFHINPAPGRGGGFTLKINENNKIPLSKKKKKTYCSRTC